jgi:putative transposase
MGRPLRIERAGGWYHVTGRGNERRAIFRDDRDREHFLELVAEMVGRFKVVLHAYQLMDNHYHLIVELREKNLSRACHWLGVSYTNWFNRRHGRSGHLFQGRFKSVAVDPLEWGLALSRYVHLNPVRIRALGLGKAEQKALKAGVRAAPEPGIVKERIRRLRSNRWGSYAAYAGLAKKPPWLTCEVILGMLGGKREERQKNYREYVESAVREGMPPSPWEQLQEGAVLGGKEFLLKLRGYVTGNAREQRGAGRLKNQHPGLAEIIDAVERLKGEKWTEFRDRYGDSGRDLVLYAGQRLCGMKLGELAVAAGMKDYGAVSRAVRRFENGLRSRTMERNQWKCLCEMYNVQM